MSRLIATAVFALAPTCDATTGITCGDVAVSLTVLRPADGRGPALRADDEGKSETAEVDLLAPVVPGDRLLVHAGPAIARRCEEAPL
jgi:hypothetical protein